MTILDEDRDVLPDYRSSSLFIYRYEFISSLIWYYAKYQLRIRISKRLTGPCAVQCSRMAVDIEAARANHTFRFAALWSPVVIKP